jgi:RNA polymerase sigma-70 factor (ECF subfamily)
LDDRSDKDLVVASCQGDRSAYGLLVERHYKNVFLTCFGILGNLHDAEDIAQDAMIKGYVRIGTLRDTSQYGLWVARIAKNLCINFFRRKKYAKKFAAETVTPVNKTATDNDRLWQAIKKLPQEIRLPLVMYYFDGQSVKTVAKRLDLSSSGVYLKLRTAIRELHNLLAK